MEQIYITSVLDLYRWVADQWRPCDQKAYSFDKDEMIDAITDYLWKDLHYNGNWNNSKPLPQDIDVFEIADMIERGYESATNCDREGFFE